MLAAIAATPIDFRIQEGLRTLERQRKLVAAGVSWTLNSRHLTGHAVDVLPVVDIDGDGALELHELYSWPLMLSLAAHIKAEAARVGVSVEWGGDWRKTPDPAHWQLPRDLYPGD